MNNNHHITDDGLRLIPQNERFPVPEKLKRADNDALDVSRWDELCIGMAEDCLTSEETARIEQLMCDDDATHEQVAAYRKLVLKSDSAVAFSDKNLLKHSTTVAFPWKKVSLGTAAAAIVLLFLGIYVFRTKELPAGQNTTTTTPSLATVTVVDKPQQTVETGTGETITPLQKAAKKIMQPAIQKPEEQQPGNTQPEEKKERIAVPKMKRLQVASPVLLASATPVHEELTLPASYYDGSTAPVIELIKVQGFFDRLTGQLIVGVNRLLNKETVEVKEFDLEGTMTYYAVHSKTFEMQRNYNKQRK